MDNKLIIKKLVLDGLDYRRILPFKNSLNVINGDRTSGKSLILTLIDYCLGKSSKINLKVQKELGSKIDSIFLELEINNEIITVKRNLKSLFNKFYIYFTEFQDRSLYTPKVLERDEFLDFISFQLDIPKFKISKYKAHSTEKTLETISFRDIMKFVYVNQHDFGTDNFLGYKSYTTRYKTKTTFEVLTKLMEPDKNNLQNEKKDLENKIKDFESNIRGFQIYLKDKEFSNIEIVDKNKDDFEYKIKECEEQKKKLYSKASENKNKDEELYINIKTKILDVDNKISHINNIIREIENSLISKKVLLKDYQKNYQELNATTESMYKLKTLDHMLVCPICESKIPSKKSDSKDFSIIQKSIKKIEQRIKLVEELIIKEDNLIITNNNKLKDLLHYKKILIKALLEYEKNIEVPYISELETLNQLIFDFSTQYHNILEAKKLHNKIIETSGLIKKSQIKLETLQAKMKKLESSKKYKENLFSNLNSDYTTYLERFKLKNILGEAYINNIDYYPYYDGSVVFNHTSGGLLQCVQIAYLISLVNEKVSNPAINHPGILMLDTLGKYLGTNQTDDSLIKDPMVYNEIYKVLIEISKNAQIFVVDNTPPVIAKGYIEYTFYDDGRGLVDENVNHLEID